MESLGTILVGVFNTIICIGMCKNVMFPNITCLCLFPPQKNKCRKDGTIKQISMKTAEIKILISICYYFVLTVYNLTGASVALWRSKLFENEVIEHFACEALGNDAAKTCSKEGFDDFTYDAINNTFYYVVFSFYPSVYFIFFK